LIIFFGAFSLAKKLLKNTLASKLKPWDSAMLSDFLKESAFGCRPLSAGHVPKPSKPLWSVILLKQNPPAVRVSSRYLKA
jgi:hypothetical protein